MHNTRDVLSALSAAGNAVATELLAGGFDVVTRAHARQLEESGDLSYLQVIPAGPVPLYRQWDAVLSALPD